MLAQAGKGQKSASVTLFRVNALSVYEMKQNVSNFAVICRSYTNMMEVPMTSTAEFPSLADSKSIPIGECRYAVASHVDAQNGFGAMIRQRYSVEMESIRGTNNWRAHNLEID